MPINQARVSTLLRKSLLGELLDTQFYLFSARSKHGNIRVAAKIRSLFANDEGLTADLKYFNSLLSEKTLKDPALIEVPLEHHPASEEILSLDDYGYASDSDLDEDEDEEEEDETNETVQDNERLELQANVSAGTTPLIKNDGTKGVYRTSPNRKILVTDTAFNTWQALLYYLYTDEIVFAPLRSQGSQTATQLGLGKPPPCSPKSMYRLACKIDQDVLRDKALAAIKSSLTEHNILQELSLSLTSRSVSLHIFDTIGIPTCRPRFPPILEMEVESLFQLITSATVMKDFPTFIKRIGGADLPHGVDILIKLHERMLRQHYPRIFSPAPPSTTSEYDQRRMGGGGASDNRGSGRGRGSKNWFS
ncbi:hypothetical protein DEU56DRAFT_982055 [Suillus clintonianus]|uniref:uncharacterized protein n=1 Tax=Suillus clintonianus TaxID=1904413 RepID=UPI001B87428D|nr:uncharacterized protein DEU56DRAFT_982055 [Suillus clintonianus]KAG2130715.1 hypothetical protein DEU56DRAFT_982055 [Suillus clintonianus]